MHPELIAKMADAHRAELHHRAEQRRLVRAGAPRASSRASRRPPWRARLGNRLIDAGLALVGRAGRQRRVPPETLLRRHFGRQAPSPG